MTRWLIWAGVEPRFDGLRTNQRFRELLGRMGIDPAQGYLPPTTETRTFPQATPVGPAPTVHKRRWPIYTAVALIILFAMVVAVKLGRSPSSPAFDRISIVKLTANGNAIAAGLSPDGKYIAYTLDEGGKQGIWIRQTGVSASVRISAPADEQYRGLTFSRDGTLLYYVAYPRNDILHGALYQVPVLGGPSKKLIDNVESPIALSPDGRRAAFIRNNQANGRDDLIIASLDDGREWTLASRHQPESFALASVPAWSPDGSVIITGVGSTDSRGAFVNLVAVQVKNGSQKLFSTERWQFVESMQWLASGSALLMVGQDMESTFQQLWRVPARGRPRRITSDLNEYIGLSATADSSRLTTVQFQVLSNIWIAPNGDINRATQITPGTGRYYDLAWTPEGRILYAADASDTVDIWSRDPDGSPPRQLTSGTHRNYGPAISPDGRRIVFHTNRTGNWNVWRMDADGGNPQPLTNDNKNESSWSQFSKDGNRVLYHRASAGGAWRLWSTPSDGGSAVQITEATCMRPVVSPRDGSVACWYTEDLPKPRWKIGIFSPEGGKPVRTFDFAPSVSVDSRLQWTPDGRNVGFVDSRGGSSNIWVQPVDGAPPRALTNFPTGQFSFAWSRDGQLAYSRGIQTSDVVMITEVH